MQAFLNTNKVLIAAILSGILLVLQQAIGATVIDWLTVGYAAGIAVLGVIANQWKNSGATITGIIGTAAYAFVTVYNGGSFTWSQFALSAATAIIAAFISELNANVPTSTTSTTSTNA